MTVIRCIQSIELKNPGLSSLITTFFPVDLSFVTILVQLLKKHYHNKEFLSVPHIDKTLLIRG